MFRYPLSKARCQVAEEDGNYHAALSGSIGLRTSELREPAHTRAREVGLARGGRSARLVQHAQKVAAEGRHEGAALGATEALLDPSLASALSASDLLCQRVFRNSAEDGLRPRSRLVTAARTEQNSSRCCRTKGACCGGAPQPSLANVDPLPGPPATRSAERLLPRPGVRERREMPPE